MTSRTARFSLLISLAMIVIMPLAAMAELQTLPDARLLEDPYNDGDSFRVAVAGRQMVIRLYGIDAPETEAHAEADLRRIREQTRYFGLTNHLQTLHFGRQAAEFTALILSEPFTVHTAFASAPGRSAEGRRYAFIQTAGGRDLGEELVKQGLARAHGVMRAGPDGVARNEMAARLTDMEHAAMIRRNGIWAASDPDLLVELRGLQRRENRELDAVREEISKLALPLDINSATLHQLQLLPGIGPVRAAAIIEQRPYRAIDELLRVEGIGAGILEIIRDMVHVGDIAEDPQP